MRNRYLETSIFCKPLDFSHMSNEYRNKHYVPVWYQKRFRPPDQLDGELFRLDLNPGTFTDPRGVTHFNRGSRKLSMRRCFVEQDLYTTRFGATDSTKIEEEFFGELDRRGRNAIQDLAEFSHPWDGTNFFNNAIVYMSIQKLRTPKGLGWLRNLTGSPDAQLALQAMIDMRRLHCAIWAECIWQIADASQSTTKFIISDHPITVYNRRCGPRSHWCRGYADPDIWLNGTHTIFPLSLEKVLILTNLSWVRNPYQSPVNLRPNPNPNREAIFDYRKIQTFRHLNEQEVREINFITKSRAFRYVAAGREEWLHPEKYVSKSHWNTYGDGYLLMPDPRSIMYGTEIMIGHGDGSVSEYDEYGRRPWQPGYTGSDQDVDDDWGTFSRFQGEFARLFGPERRGRAINGLHLDNERDDDEYHQFHLSLEKKFRNQN